MKTDFFKGLQLLVFALLVGCANDKPENGTRVSDTTTLEAPARDTIASLDIDTSLVIHPNTTMEKVILDVNSHISNIPKTGNIDNDFIEIVRVYNQALMEMAYMEQTNGKNQKLLSWASTILRIKRAENVSLGKLKSDANAVSAKSQPFYEDISHQMKDRMYLPPTSTLSIDEQFAILLVPHHQTAMNMGRIFLKYSNNADLRKFTEKMMVEYEQDMEKIKHIESELKI